MFYIHYERVRSLSLVSLSRGHTHSQLDICLCVQTYNGKFAKTNLKEKNPAAQIFGHEKELSYCRRLTFTIDLLISFPTLPFYRKSFGHPFLNPSGIKIYSILRRLLSFFMRMSVASFLFHHVNGPVHCVFLKQTVAGLGQGKTKKWTGKWITVTVHRFNNSSVFYVSQDPKIGPVQGNDIDQK